MIAEDVVAAPSTPAMGVAPSPCINTSLILELENQTVWGKYTAMLSERQALCTQTHRWPQAGLFLSFALCNDFVANGESDMHVVYIQITVPHNLCQIHYAVYVGLSIWDQTASAWNPAASLGCLRRPLEQGMSEGQHCMAAGAWV